MQIGTQSLSLATVRQQFQQQVFSRLSAGQDGIGLQPWREALQSLPGASANNAGVTGTGTASAIDAAFKSLDANGDGQLSQTEFNATLDRMLERARKHRDTGGSGSTPLDAQLLAGQQAAGGVQAPDFLRRMLLGYAGAT